MPIKGWIEVNDRYCKGCSLCVSACPKEVLALDMDRLTPKGYHPAYLISDGCTGAQFVRSFVPILPSLYIGNHVKSKLLKQPDFPKMNKTGNSRKAYRINRGVNLRPRIVQNLRRIITWQNNC